MSQSWTEWQSSVEVSEKIPHMENQQDCSSQISLSQVVVELRLLLMQVSTLVDTSKRTQDLLRALLLSVEDI